jgi:Bacterial TniB protein
VRADRWIGYTRATQALDKMGTLLAWPARQRMPNLLVIGPTNNGKSMIIEKFRRSHPPVSHPDREEIPVLVVQMPSDRLPTSSGARSTPTAPGPGRAAAVPPRRPAAGKDAVADAV